MHQVCSTTVTLSLALMSNETHVNLAHLKHKSTIRSPEYLKKCPPELVSTSDTSVLYIIVVSNPHSFIFTQSEISNLVSIFVMCQTFRLLIQIQIISKCSQTNKCKVCLSLSSPLSKSSEVYFETDKTIQALTGSMIRRPKFKDS